MSQGNKLASNASNKINVDGASKNNLGFVGCGDLIKDKDGMWLTRFTHNMRICTSFIG